MGDVGIMGLHVPGMSWQEIRDSAVLAEELGYSCLTMGESWGEDCLTSLAQLAAVTSRIRHEASSVEEIYVDNDRSDRRMQELIHAAKSAGIRIIQTDDQRLSNIVGTRRHQGVVAKAGELSLARNLDELLDAIEGPPLLLILDGITDPHNLGACLRVADGVGAHAVIAPATPSMAERLRHVLLSELPSYLPRCDLSRIAIYYKYIY